MVKRKAKYGRLCNANRAQYQENVNFLYWNTACCTAMIARNLGISESSVSKLVLAKPAHLKFEDTPHPNQQGGNLHA